MHLTVANAPILLTLDSQPSLNMMFGILWNETHVLEGNMTELTAGNSRGDWTGTDT